MSVTATDGGPAFEPGPNILIKVLGSELEETREFYRHVLQLTELPRPRGLSEHATGFRYGSGSLWIDQAQSLAEAGVWLELKTDDLARATGRLRKSSAFCVEVGESPPHGERACWVSAPGSVIHLVTPY